MGLFGYTYSQFAGQRTSAAVATVALASSLLAVTSPSAVVQTGGQEILLTAKTQPRVDRPVLDSIKRSAQEQGISLEEAVNRYVAKAASSSRAATANWPDGPVSTPDVLVDDLSAVELEDLKSIAKSQGITFAQAIDRHGWWRRYKGIATQIRNAAPDEFSGVVRAADGSSVWFGFKGEIPPKAVALAKTLPVQVLLEGNRGYSEAELAAAKDSIHRTVLSRSEVVDAVSGYDIRTGVIQVTAQLHELPASQNDRNAILARITPAQTLGASSARVEVGLTDKPVSVEMGDNYLRGGGNLHGCTAGFNLKYATTETKRLGSAGHCILATGGMREYSNQPADVGTIAYTYVKPIWGPDYSFGDIGYFDHGQANGGPLMTPTRTFYWGWGEKRYADYQDPYPAVGDPVCKFGMTTGRTCTVVRRTDVTSGSRYHLSESEMLGGDSGDGCDGGDSGGPWFNGSTAYGIHFGAITESGGSLWRCAFTHVQQFAAARDYYVWIRG